jgi:hypothetical protein
MSSQPPAAAAAAGLLLGTLLLAGLAAAAAACGRLLLAALREVLRLARRLRACRVGNSINRKSRASDRCIIERQHLYSYQTSNKLRCAARRSLPAPVPAIHLQR